jgi:hypothetical protein
VLLAVTIVMRYVLPGVKVNAEPESVQLLQLEPIRKFVGTTLPGEMVGPAHVASAYWSPDESETVYETR